MMWGWHDLGWWWFLLMAPGMLGFWALVAWAVVGTVAHGRGPRPPASPQAILAERFTRGDIDEYHRRLNELAATGAARAARVTGGD